MNITVLLALAVFLEAGEWTPLEVTATAYCPCKICCGVRAAGITANNTKVKDVPYGVASSPDHLPYGTSVWIPTGYGYLDHTYPSDEERCFSVDDTGGIVRRRTRETGRVHIDLRFIQHRNAVRFGVKWITIYVWTP